MIVINFLIIRRIWLSPYFFATDILELLPSPLLLHPAGGEKNPAALELFLPLFVQGYQLMNKKRFENTRVVKARTMDQDLQMVVGT